MQDENIKRKQYHNMMEDMKGKIRVFARARPVLKFEAARGAKNALIMPDVLTLQHMWKDKKREYSFDSVFDQTSSQEMVRPRSMHYSPSEIPSKECSLGISCDVNNTSQEKAQRDLGLLFITAPSSASCRRQASRPPCVNSEP